MPYSSPVEKMPRHPGASAGHTAACTSAGELVRIFEPAVQIAVLERPADAAITAYLEAVAECLNAGRLGFHVRRADRPLPDLELPAGGGRDALIAEISWLTELFADLLGCPAVGLRIQALDHPMCPRFHVDRTGIRLVCTWRGPGTEWLDDGWADRSRLGAGNNGLPDETSGLFLPGAEVQRMPTFALGLLKGSLWQDNEGRGVIHRSPQVNPGEAPRVMLALDAIWED